MMKNVLDSLISYHVSLDVVVYETKNVLSAKFRHTLIFVIFWTRECDLHNFKPTIQRAYF